MKITLTVTGDTLEGDTSALARVLAALEDSFGVTVSNSVSAPSPSPAPSPAPAPIVPPVAGPAPVAPLPMPTLPPLAAPADDDDGPANAAAPSVDAAGLPWDERIHAKTKATNADNTWRKRRGVDEATIATVEADLRARTPVAAPLAPPPPLAPVPAPTELPVPAAIPAPEPIPAPVAAAPAPVAAAVPTAPPPSALADVAALATGPLDFAQFMGHISQQMAKPDAAGLPTIHTEYLTQVAGEVSAAFLQAGRITAPLMSITNIANDPAMIEYAIAVIKRDGRW